MAKNQRDKSPPKTVENQSSDPNCHQDADDNCQCRVHTQLTQSAAAPGRRQPEKTETPSRRRLPRLVSGRNRDYVDRAHTCVVHGLHGAKRRPRAAAD